jgi:hypothetical protein
MFHFENIYASIKFTISLNIKFENFSIIKTDNKYV